MQQPSNDKKPGLSWSTPASAASTPKQQPPKLQSPTTPLALPKTVLSNTSNGNSTMRYVGIFVGGLAVGVVVAWGWSALTHKADKLAVTTTSAVVSPNTTTKSAATATKTATAQTSASNSVASSVVLQDAALTVPSPQAAGQSVTIEKIEVTAPTWVVVYDNVNGKPGNVLGAQLFFTNGSGIVTLLRPTVAGKSYLVGRSTDDGDHKFQKTSDQMVVDSSGNPVLATFNAN